MTRNPHSRRTLLEKISGPGAVPVALLVEKGEAAAAKARESLAGFLDRRILDLSAMYRRLGERPQWREFYAAVVDLRGTAAMAGRHAVAAIAASLEALLEECAWDERAATVLVSHLDALVLVSSGRQGEEAVRLLVAELSQAVARLRPGAEAMGASA